MDARPDPDGLDAADLARLGALHVECIADSLPALLGPRFATRLYAWLATSPSEVLMWERVAGTIESAVVVSTAPGSLQWRIVRGTLPQLVPAAFAAVWQGAPFRRFLAETARELRTASAEGEHAPEITYVFTSPQSRGQSLGKRLIARVDALLAGRGVDAYFVKTLDDPSNGAIRFYQREGFERVGTRDSAGRRFVEFRKRLR